MQPPPQSGPRLPVARQNEYLTALAGVAVLTLLCWVFRPLTGYAAIALIYLLGVVLAGMVLNRGPVLLFAALSAVCWNFLFIPPLFTFHIATLEDALMFATYFIVALAVGTLTARLRAREHLAARLHVAEESERLRKSLLDCVSHELKTPIAAIGAASEALVRAEVATGNGDTKQQLAAEILQGSRRLNRVVDNLLDMTRLESGVIAPKPEWCDVRDLLETAIDAERAATPGRPINIDAPEDLPLISIDHGLVTQAVAKLIANAVLYTPDDSAVEISARVVDGAVLIAVSDRGPGLREGEAERIFEKFYRGETARAGGVGLGLAIARGFVEAHGGTLRAANRAEGGACFTISLPARTTDARALEHA